MHCYVAAIFHSVCWERVPATAALQHTPFMSHYIKHIISIIIIIIFGRNFDLCQFLTWFLCVLFKQKIGSLRRNHSTEIEKLKTDRELSKNKYYSKSIYFCKCSV